jgi:hypothetical protein
MPKPKSYREDLLQKSVSMLEDIYEIAKKKEDTETMTSVSDRICLLYEKEMDIETDTKSATGFTIIGKDEDE